QYQSLLLEGLRLKASVAKNTNVLQHMMGYFKKQLSRDEKEELLEILAQYRQGLVPLIVPVTLINHYVRKYDEPYLKGQYYLHPHPLELKLRNHV
ncbi:MAG: YbgA family protein, partial [Deltaproteobacteria bacterium]|nr:YbgA family protein [Deltaproteobacteria bacterium]